jgi:hypothetical protein
MSRRGKIASLPQALRDEVNRRLADGKTARSLVSWLNDLPEVQAVLQERFNSEPVSDSNLSEWRLGGYQDWLDRRDKNDLLREVCAQSAEIAASSPAAPTPAATLIASAKLFQALQDCDAVADPDRFRRLLLSLAHLSTAEEAARHHQVAQERLRQTDRKLQFEERRVKALEARLAAARHLLDPAENKGGITPETLARIQEALRIL